MLRKDIPQSYAGRDFTPAELELIQQKLAAGDFAPLIDKQLENYLHSTRQLEQAQELSI